MTDDWQPKLGELVATLRGAGSLRSADLIDAFAAIPRHLFTPDVLVTSANGYRTLSGTRPAERDEWLSLVYSDESLVTQDKPHAAGYTLPTGERLRIPTSSSTMPGLMARMLEALDIRDGMRILEIGTGTGYNAALLAHRIGDRNVVSVDIDPTLIEHAAARLAELDYAPTLVAGDGALGAAAHGPYDRIIATAAVAEIPVAWIQQLRPGGKILANLRGELAGATLCLLTKHDTDDEVIGPVLPIGGHFMWLRHDVADPHRKHEYPMAECGRSISRTTTTFDPAGIPVDNEAFRYLLQLQLRGVRILHQGRAFDPGDRSEHAAVVVGCADGSRAEIFTEPDKNGSYRTVHSGHRGIADTVEATCRLFEDLGRPRAEQFGVVANDSIQFVWLGADDGWYRWSLPLV